MNVDVNTRQQTAFIQLFKSAINSIDAAEYLVTPREQIAKGVLFIDSIGTICLVPNNVFQAAVDEYGTDVVAFNRTFHKSFKTMAFGNPMELVLYQMLNYLSTYGMESADFEALNYVPMELLEIPADAFNIKRLTIIHLVSLEHAKNLLNEYLKTLTAPNDRIRTAVADLFSFVTNTPDEIKSFEIMAMYCDYKCVYPTNPISGLRYVIYKATGTPMIIKNRRTIETIKRHTQCDVNTEIPARVFTANLTGYASIFLRYKPLFLAFKKYPHCARLINQMRRMSDTYHKPLPDTAIQNFINLMKKGRCLHAITILDKASNRDLVKIINACTARATTDGAPAVYAIRNGRLFVKENGISALSTKDAQMYLYCVTKCINKLHTRLSETLSGKTFVLPTDIEYAVPTTEKQMLSTIPYGTCIHIPKDFSHATVGVHWTNNKIKDMESRVDIDLHAHSANANFGWNSYWRDGSDVVYSGDNTNAPIAKGGAAEAFWVKLGQDDIIFDVSLYYGHHKTEFKFFLTNNARNEMHRNFTFDASKLLCTPVRLSFTGQRGASLGMLTGKEFYFYGGSLQTNIIPRGNYADAITGMKNLLKSKMKMASLLKIVGARFISPDDFEQLKQDDPEAAAQVISLMPEDLTPSTLLDIVDGKVE